MNKRGSNDPLWPMNRHPDQTFREDVSHSEKEIPSSYLESLFAPTFKAHYTALSPNFLADGDATARAKNLEALVQYLLSIDAATPTVAIPAAGPLGGDFCSP